MLFNKIASSQRWAAAPFKPSRSIPLTFLLGKTREQLLSRTDLGPSEYAVFGTAWVDRGATITGGCCEVGPAHIRAMRDQLLQQGHSIRSPLDPATHPYKDGRSP
jgi:Homocysteine S-methyltransferase